MKKTAKDYASRPYAKWGLLLGSVLLWLTFFGICIISIIGIPRDFSSEILQFISERGLIPGAFLALAGGFLFSKYKGQ